MNKQVQVKHISDTEALDAGRAATPLITGEGRIARQSI